MQQSMKLIRIFIGSPGGLSDERKAARDIFEEVNVAHGEQWGVQFRIVAWEDTVPGYQRAQSKINEDLDRCEYFLGVLHDRWGTPPSNDPGGFSSGFEEEYYRAEEAIKAGRMKDMALFFKRIETLDGFIPGPEVQKVLDFRTKQVEGKVNYFRDFSTLEEFKGEIRNKLNEIGWKESGLAERERESDPSQREPSPTETISVEEVNKSKLFDTEARDFIASLLEKPDDWDATEPFEIARLRLIAASVTRSSNSDITLGAHDANLVFRALRDVPLSQQENTALIDSGVVGFEHCNVPLWRWLARGEASYETGYYRLRILATVGNDEEQRNAIRVLQSLGEPIPTHDSDFNTLGVLREWFSEDTRDRVFDTAVSFLSSNGGLDDVPFIEQALANTPEDRKNKVEGAVVGILARYDVDAALKRVCEHGVDKLDAKIVGRMFDRPASLTTETLIECLSAKPDDIRLRSARLLHDRAEITADLANTLLTDGSHDIRLVAVEALRQLGELLDEDVIKKALTIEKTAMGLFSFTGKETDTTVYEKYRRNRLFELSESELREAIRDSLTFGQEELAVLYSKFGSRKHILEEIRQNLLDGFESYLRSATNLPSNSQSPERIVLGAVIGSDFRRKRFCEDAVSALCAARKSEDLELVRGVLDRLPIKATESILSYLRRFGDWSDISRINKLDDDGSSRGGLLGVRMTLLPDERASAVLALGRHRLADLLDCDLQYSIRTAILKLMSSKDIAGLTDSIALRELSHENSRSRIIFALRCIQSLSKKRIKGLLDRYLGGDEYRYYSSIHWLDLGASLPSRTARMIAENEISLR